MILSVSNINKSFHEVPILKNVSFHIEDYEKAAIVGINGAGKTTLLRIIMGELSADDGLVTLAKDRTVGYLSQQEAVSGENTIYQELLCVKQDILDMERQMHTVELQMKTASGDHLAALMDAYASLTHAYETANGYAY
ncbi:MAG: ATP-binding cassette domain-containing protein, partial [Lachnospiraceae bacterium]|nr:ATP-binding cassette domain-containing protein [Lachnospiraceae bacterium]